jgi:hypothetical protein
MKRVSRKIGIGGVLVFVAGVLVFCGPFAGCRPPAWRDGPFAPSFCKRGPPGFADKNFSERVLKHMDSHVEELNLNETQRQSYEALKTRLKAHFEEGKAKRTAWVGELRTELNKEKPDIQFMAAHIKKAARELPEAVDRHVDLFVEFYSLLDEGQKMKVVRRFRDRMGGPSSSSPPRLLR